MHPGTAERTPEQGLLTSPTDRHFPLYAQTGAGPLPIAGTDAITSVLGTALDGLSLRQNVIADNIANVDTPGFRATSVDFESSLANAISTGDLGSAAVTTTPTNTPVGADGNNVDLRKETMAAMQTVFQYQMLTRAVNDRMDLVKTAAGA